jgi:hypothetical protein
MTEPGLDLHEWETRWQQALDDASDDAPGALGEMDELIREMLLERGYQIDEPTTADGEEPEVVRQYRAAREVRLQVDGGDFDPGDVADAIDGYRAIYELLATEFPAP